MNEDKAQKMKFRIVGTVQNVGYRSWLKNEADRRKIRGWVRNESDGAVSALLAGNDEQLAELAGLLRLGPDGAEVIDAISLHLEDEDEAWSGEGFAIRTG